MGKKYIVYKHTTPNNKVYIGITCQSENKRWRYGYGYTQCTYFYKAIKKYGWKNIKHDILFNNLSRDEAIKKEIELIAQYQSNNQEYGYNLTKGGDGNFGVVFSEERKRNISKAKMGHSVSEETKEKIRESQSGMKHWNFGKTMPQETKNKISQAHKGMIFTDEHKKNMSLSHIGKVAWNKGKPMTKDTKQKLIDSSKKKSVLCVELNTKYQSIRDAYRKTHTNYNHIAEVCKGIRKTANGYHWQFVGGVE